MKLQHSAKTDVGKARDVNQDQFGVGELLPDGSQLFVVCDGMGGHLAGEVASQAAVETLMEAYRTTVDPNRPQVLAESIRIANQTVFERGRGNMGTTAVALLLYRNIGFIANVGDSRAYMLRGSQLRQISIDHSFVEDQVRAGLMTRDQARHSNVKNIITRAVGHQRDVQADIFREPLQPGDIFLLCSDGLHGQVEDETLVEVLSSQAPDQATETLIRLANDSGGPDNITALIVKVEELDAIGSDDPILASLLAATPRTTTMLPETLEGSGPSGTARMPTMSDDAPAIAATAPLPARTEAAPPPPAAPTREPGLTLWGGLGALLVLGLLVGGLYFLQLPPFAEPTAATPPPTAQTGVATATSIPTVTLVLSPTRPLSPTLTVAPQRSPSPGRTPSPGPARTATPATTPTP